MIKHLIPILILSSFLILTHSLQAQTKIRGVVLDDETSMPVPFASVSFMNTNIGSVTDFDGIFFLDAHTDSKKIIFNCIGYKNDTLEIVNDQYQDYIVYLVPESYTIEEVVVNAGENPADILMKKVLRNKKHNNTNRLQTYSYEQYTKMQVDLNNFNPTVKNDKLLKDFAKTFEGMDTSSATGKIYMPIIISETLSDYYFQSFPRQRKEKIKALNVAGVENISAGQFTGQMYVDFNFYMNFMNILEKQFISPLSQAALITYEYYLIDSAFIDNSWCYHMTFKPKRSHEFTFRGDMWITDSTYALKQISAHMSETANLEFVSSFYVKKDYAKIGDFYFPDKEEFFIDFNISKFTAGFFGRKYTSRKNIELNPDFPNFFFSATEFRDIEVDRKAADYDSASWAELRHTALTNKEVEVFNMVDSVKETKTFQRVENFVYLVATGYLKRNYIEFGPYYKLYSRNAIEGHRFRLGMRTSNDFSKTIELNAYAAFGLDDQRGKYGAGTKIKISREPWTLAQISLSRDMVQLGANLGDFGSDNIFAVSGKNDKLLFMENFEVGVEIDLLKSLTGTFFFTHKEIFPTDSMVFEDSEGNPVENITTTEFTVSAHFGINEEYIEAVFNRQSFGSLYPILEFEYTWGIPDMFDSDFEYHKFTLGLKHHISLGFFGKTKYYIEAGKILGTVPFPLLKLHEGREGIAYDMISFNMMDYYEFASDQYVSFFAEHHFNGLLFNKIPLIRKLKFREVVFAKGAWGSLKDSNREVIQFSGTLSDISEPYFEAGVGIENILTFFSINYFRRITHIGDPNVRKNGFFIGIQASF